jgi:hypothetical protein
MVHAWATMAPDGACFVSWEECAKAAAGGDMVARLLLFARSQAFDEVAKLFEAEDDTLHGLAAVEAIMALKRA